MNTLETTHNQPATGEDERINGRFPMREHVVNQLRVLTLIADLNEVRRIN